jgi:hypothetical protein
MMSILYPAKWTEPVAEAKAAQSSEPGMAMIRALTDKAPMSYEELVARVKKAEEGLGRFWRRADILGWIQEIDAERRPKVEPKGIDGEVKP